MKLSEKELKRIIEEHINVWCSQRGELSSAERGVEALMELGYDILDYIDNQDRSGHLEEVRKSKKIFQEEKIQPFRLVREGSLE